MGEMNISREQTEQDRRRFMRAVLNDLNALEMMIDNGLIESGITRIGAEQEMFLVDKNFSPACKSVEILVVISMINIPGTVKAKTVDTKLDEYFQCGECKRRFAVANNG